MNTFNRFQLEILLAAIALILGLYIPYDAHFNTSGPFGFFESLFFILLCYGITFNIVLNFFAKKWEKKKRFISLLLALTGTTIACSIFYVDHRTFEEIDWLMNYDTRNRIVKEILNKQTKTEEFKLQQLHTWIPVSNGGNEIFVQKSKAGITVKFWIDRGFLDTHSEFVFTNCPEELAAIHHLLKVHPNNDNYRKIESNWYRLNNY